MHVFGYANPKATELFTRLATLFVTGHLVFGSFVFFGFGPSVVARRNLWNKLSQVVVSGCVETLVPYSGFLQHGRTFKVISYCQSNLSKALHK